MKLNTKRTVLIGLAFMTICTFWQVYNNVIPLILKTTFDMNEALAGAIMGADNVLALFMLPLFGMLSDKTNSKFGKRKPYILFGTITAVISMIFLVIFNTPTTFVPFVIFLGIVLLAMSTYRSPAVALMPDITPKPLLSKANAIINLMGTVGGIIALVLIALLVPKGDNPSYLILFVSVAIIMLLGVIILSIFGDEKKFNAEKEQIENQNGFTEKKETITKSKLSPEKRKSLIFMLSAIFLWFFGYNAIISAYSKYAVVKWNLDGGLYAYALIVAQVVALIAFIPIGNIATKIGRKKTIFIGIFMLSLAFLIAGFFQSFSIIILFLFGLAGIGWASINVNSYPMIVSLSEGSDIGKYTGFYYTASMSSQIVTPILSGLLLQYVGYWTLFPYGAIFIALSAIPLFFVKHGDSMPIKKESKLEAFDVED
ncbi:MFS transporter [Clostridium sp. DL1XJH146]